MFFLIPQSFTETLVTLLRGRRTFHMGYHSDHRIFRKMCQDKSPHFPSGSHIVRLYHDRLKILIQFRINEYQPDPRDNDPVRRLRDLTFTGRRKDDRIRIHGDSFINVTHLGFKILLGIRSENRQIHVILVSCHLRPFQKRGPEIIGIIPCFGNIDYLDTSGCAGTVYDYDPRSKNKDKDQDNEPNYIFSVIFHDSSPPSAGMITETPVPMPGILS